MKMSEVHIATGKLPPDWSECTLIVRQRGEQTFLTAGDGKGKHKLYDPEKQIWEDVCS